MNRNLLSRDDLLALLMLPGPSSPDWPSEAVQERDPAFELQGDAYASTAPTLSMADARVWEAMVSTRPMLRCLRG